MNKKHHSIFIVAHMIRGGGAETFLRGLLPQLIHTMNETRFVCLVAESRRNKYENIENVSFITVDDSVLNSMVKRVRFDNYDLAKIVKKESPNLILSAAEVIPLSLTKKRIPIVLIYHATLQFYMKPDIDNSALKLLYTRITRDRIAKKADLIISVSHFERGEVGARYHCHRFDKSAVVYHGVDHKRFYPLEQNEAIDSRFSYKYILCISDFHSHKKMEEMVEIFHFMVDNGVEEHLVLIGREKNQDASNKIKNAIRKYNLEDRIHLIDYIDNSELRNVYLKSTFYWTHSRYESFGMTPLEAMSCGVPVFAAWRESLPEVYGDSVLFYNPFIESFKDIANKAKDFIDSPDKLKMYSKRGQEHSLKFTWEKTAKEYSALLNGLLEK